MNKSVLVAVILPSILIGCTEPEVDFNELVSRGGVYFIASTDEPFSGVALHRNRQGSILGRYQFDDGLFEGKASTWFPNGQLSQEGQMGEGYKQGEWASWYEDGTKYQVASFVDGSSDGWHEVYNKYGVIFKRGLYDEGQPLEFQEYQATYTTKKPLLVIHERYNGVRRDGKSEYLNYSFNNDKVYLSIRYICDYEDGKLVEIVKENFGSDVTVFESEDPSPISKEVMTPENSEYFDKQGDWNCRSRFAEKPVIIKFS